MASATGVTPTGFVAKTVQDILADIEADELSIIDAQLDLSPEEPIGQLNGIMAEKLAEVWELGGTAYNSISRDDAENTQLDNIGGLTGTKRLTAIPSVATGCTCHFTTDGTYTAGTLIANVSGQPTATFANAADVVVSGSPIDIGNLSFIATATGPTVANSGTLTQINTPVSGWASITNTVDATLGMAEEQDTPYRLRQDQEISAVGSSTLAAMQASVSQVQGVISAKVVENTGDVVNVLGDLPHSYHVVVWDGATPAAANNAIAQAIFNDKPCGIPGNGTLSGLATDANGATQSMVFDRVVQESLYMTLVCTLATGVSAASIAPLVKAAIVAYCNANLGIGSEVVALAIKAQALTVPGVIDVTSFAMDIVPSPVASGNLFFNNLQIPLADTSRMTVNGL